MSIVPGQPVSAATVNTAFMSRNSNTNTSGIIALENISSGAFVTNLQQTINDLLSGAGGDNNYASNEVIADGQTRKQAIEALDAEFNSATGHDHSGAGQGKPINAQYLTNINLLSAAWQSFSYVAASGTSIDVTLEFGGKVDGGSPSIAGVITDPPKNKVAIYDAATLDFIEDGEGQRVYGRITFAASVWTLSFYTNEAGVETPHSLASTDIFAYFLEVFTQASRPTIPDGPEFGSLDVGADVVDATELQRGLVSTGTQSFGGDKSFYGSINVISGSPGFPGYVAEGKSIYLLTEGTGTVNDQVVWLKSVDDETCETYMYNSGATAFGPAGGGIGTFTNHGFSLWANNVNRVLVRPNGQVDMADNVVTGGVYWTDHLSRLALFTDGGVSNALVCVDGTDTVRAYIDNVGKGGFSELQTEASLIGKEIATPSVPPAGYGKIYFKADGRAYSQDDAGVETQLGGGTGGFTTPTTDSSFGNVTANGGMTGTGNIAIGHRAMDSMTTGANNVAIGPDALTAATTATNSVCIGYQAGMAIIGASDNTVIGYQALLSATNGDKNVAIGRQALRDLVSGTQNVAIGAFAHGFGLSSTSNSVAIGFECMKDAKAGAGNSVAIGAQCMFVLTTGTQNTAIGYQALRLTSTGGSNTGVGYQAIDAVTTASENTAVGSNAGGALTTGGMNTAIGTDALAAETVQTAVTAIGYKAMSLANGAGVGGSVAVGAFALQNLTTGGSSTAVGYQSLKAVTTGNRNTAVGYETMLIATTGARNSALGMWALTALTSGSDNVAVGESAGLAISSGASNVAIGSSALATATTPTEAVAVGYQAMQNASGAGVALSTAVGTRALRGLTTGLRNVAVGYEAGRLITTGAQNTAIGYIALTTLVGSDGNTAVGYAALTVSTGNNNTALGAQAMSGITTGAENVAIGTRAGTNLTTSSNDNIAIGYQAQAGTTGANCNIVIGALAGSAMTTGDNNILIGTQSDTSSPTASGEAVLGSNNFPIVDFYIGANPRAAGAAIAATRSIRPGGNPTGTNQSAATIAFRIVGAVGTGTGDGGPIRFATAQAGASGSAQNTIVDRWEVTQAGFIYPMADAAYDIGDFSIPRRIRGVLAESFLGIDYAIYDNANPTTVSIASISGEAGVLTVAMTAANTDFVIDGAGSGLRLTAGANAKFGTATLVAGAVTINTTRVTAGSKFIYSVQAAGGTQGFLSIANVVPGTSFDIVSTSGTDTSEVTWLILEEV